MADSQTATFSKENLITLINESEALKVLPGVLKEKLLASVLVKPEEKQIQIFSTLKEEQAKFKEAEREYMEKSAKAYQDYLGELKNATNSIMRGLNRKVEEFSSKADNRKADDLLKNI